MGHPLDPDGVSGSNHVSLSSTSFPFSSASSFSILSLSLHSPPSPSFLPPLPPPPPSLFPPFPPFPPSHYLLLPFSLHSLVPDHDEDRDTNLTESLLEEPNQDHGDGLL